LLSRDEHFINLALKQAKKGLGLTSPNPPVGAVIVANDGTILGRGYHHRAGGPHAEIEAIRKSLKKCTTKDLNKATIYVTLEPCSTCGKTPACTDAIIKHQFTRVVYACSDPNPQHQGRAKQILTKQGITVSSGVLEKKAQHLIRFFSKSTSQGLPWVIAKSAMTLDARTTLPPGHGQWITGKKAIDNVHLLRSQVDAILIGGATLRQDNPRLTLRGKHARKIDPQPWRIITTLTGNLPKESHVFTDIHRERTQVFHQQSLRQVLKNLAKQGIHSVLMESGGKLLANAFKNDLIDEIVFYYAPVLGGGNTHALQMDNLCRSLSKIQTKKFGCDLRLRALIKRD